MKKKISAIMLAFCLIISMSGADCRASAKKYTKTITISAVGDCTLGSDSRYNSLFVSKYKEKGADYFLKNVKSVFKKDDLTLVNLEGTLTGATTRANKTFTFKGSTSYTKILTGSGVEAVNLANNHTMDYGQKGFDDTVAALKEAGIKYSGYSKIAYYKTKGIKIAMIGLSALSANTESDIVKQTKDLIKKARDHGADIVITSFHWGVERDYYPNSRQVNIAKAAIDNGSDLVIGHHPHVLQGISMYKGKYIAYSLGNFCFGGNSNPSDKNTIILQVTYNLKDKKIISTSAKAIPCSLSGAKSCNDFQPKLLSGGEKTDLLKKLNTYDKGMHAVINEKSGVITKDKAKS